LNSKEKTVSKKGKREKEEKVTAARLSSMELFNQ
jgi:hypothetical protein